MSLDLTEDSLSDDDIFFGKLTLTEVKKRLFWDNEQKPNGGSVVNSPRKYEDHNTSLKILRTHSEPNLLPAKDRCNYDTSINITSGWDMGEDDSFIKLESMVQQLCVSPKKTEELNNTLEVIEYILNNAPKCEAKTEIMTDIKQKNVNSDPKSDYEVTSEFCSKKLHQISPQKTRKVEEIVVKDSPELLRNISPQKYRKVEKITTMDTPEPPQNTPVKTETKYARQAGHMTPVYIEPKPIFKTPAQPLSLLKPSTPSMKKTPSKLNAYQHISSPVASYIKNCPIVPLVKDVHPKKPLPGPSSIPKLKNSAQIKQSNKENVNLPSVAYKSAKKTKLIDVPDEQKLPQCPWAKKIMTAVPRPMVIKHDHREQNLAKRKLLPQQEDSFADLSYNQAEVSVCTQKSAIKLKKNI